MLRVSHTVVAWAVLFYWVSQMIWFLIEVLGLLQALAEKDVGDFIIRPSCKGPAHLSITMKVSDGLFSHIDVLEGNKENWDLASFLRLGKTLSIGDDSYKSIDEV